MCWIAGREFWIEGLHGSVTNLLLTTEYVCYFLQANHPFLHFKDVQHIKTVMLLVLPVLTEPTSFAHSSFHLFRQSFLSKPALNIWQVLTLTLSSPKTRNPLSRPVPRRTNFDKASRKDGWHSQNILGILAIYSAWICKTKDHVFSCMFDWISLPIDLCWWQHALIILLRGFVAAMTTFQSLWLFGTFAAKSKMI